MNINTSMIRILAIMTSGLLFTMVSLTAEATLPGNVRSRWSWSSATERSSVDLGSASNKTCFLSGVGGTLANGDPVFGVAGAYISIDANNHYQLVVDAGQSANQAEAHATCLFIAPSSATPSPVTTTGNTQVMVAQAVPGRQCFLTGIVSRWTALSSADAKIEVSIIGSNWVLVNSGLPVNDNSVDSFAQCVDLPNTTAVFQENNWTGTFTVSAMQETSSAPVACGLRGFKGAFTGATGDDGVNLNWPS